MTIAFLRDNHVDPDPRIEKEVRSLLTRYDHISILAWDREEKSGNSEILDLGSGTAQIVRFQLRAKHGAGMKNLMALIRFQLFIGSHLWRLRKELEAIHAANFSTALTGLFMARLLKVPLVYDIYDYYVESFPVPKMLVYLVEHLDIAVINRADAVIICTERRMAQLHKSTPRSLSIIHNVPDSVPLEESPIATDRISPRRFVYVGGLDDGRLLEELLSMFARRDDWELHIGGFGPLEQVVSRFADENDNIVFYARVPYVDALKIEATASVLFAVYDPEIPNHKYSAPNKFYEALFVGKPIIVARGTGVDDLLEEYGVGIAIDYSVESFEQGAEKMLAQDQLLRDMGARGKRVFATEFAWSIMEERLFDIYERVLQPAALS